MLYLGTFRYAAKKTAVYILNSLVIISKFSTYWKHISILSTRQSFLRTRQSFLRTRQSFGGKDFAAKKRGNGIVFLAVKWYPPMLYVCLSCSSPSLCDPFFSDEISHFLKLNSIKRNCVSAGGKISRQVRKFEEYTLSCCSNILGRLRTNLTFTI